jgi:hypothetical protein
MLQGRLNRRWQIVENVGVTVSRDNVSGNEAIRRSRGDQDFGGPKAAGNREGRRGSTIGVSWERNGILGGKGRGRLERSRDEIV